MGPTSPRRVRRDGRHAIADNADYVDDHGSELEPLVARRFVATELETADARGIASGDRFALEAFEPIVGHATVDPDELSERPAAAD